MKNLILSNSNEMFLNFAIMTLFVAIALVVYTYIKGKMDKSSKNIDFSKFNGRIHVTIKEPFLPAKAFAFYNALQRALPLAVIAFPNVGVDTIVAPAGDLVAYKAIQAKYVDFVIFDKMTMKPLAVVDLIDPHLASGSIIQQDEAITKTLATVNIPVLEFRVQKAYDEKAILGKFLDSQDPYTIAQMKKNNKNA